MTHTHTYFMSLGSWIRNDETCYKIWNNGLYTHVRYKQCSIWGMPECTCVHKPKRSLLSDASMKLVSVQGDSTCLSCTHFGRIPWTEVNINRRVITEGSVYCGLSLGLLHDDPNHINFCWYLSIAVQTTDLTTEALPQITTWTMARDPRKKNSKRSAWRARPWKADPRCDEREKWFYNHGE